MYNHYIPQSDGTFRRSPAQEPQRRQPPKSSPPPKPEPKPEPAPPPCPPEPCGKPEHPAAESNPLSFLRKLLPKDLDAGDLAVIALLLLLCGSEEDGDDLAPLLTIALYFLL